MKSTAVALATAMAPSVAASMEVGIEMVAVPRPGADASTTMGVELQFAASSAVGLRSPSDGAVWVGADPKSSQNVSIFEP